MEFIKQAVYFYQIKSLFNYIVIDFNAALFQTQAMEAVCPPNMQKNFKN